MKIAAWVPLGMDVLSTLTFGRSDALILISVEFYVLFMCERLFRVISSTNLQLPSPKKIPPGKPAHCKEPADAAYF